MQTRRPSVEGALAALNEHQKSDYVVVRRFDAEVNHGAVLLEGSSGRKVLKVLPPTESLAPQFNAARSTAAVRPSGYPAPRYEAIEEYGDGRYVLMTALPGDKCDFLRDGVEQARQIILLNDLQQDVAVLPTTWPQVMIDHVLYGGGGCYPDVMARHSGESADLLDVLQQMALNHSESAQSETGVVHNDLNPGNILSVGDQVTGVVDWENTCNGDPAYDLAYLWYCIYKHEHVRPVLWEALIDRARPEAIAFWLSHIIVGFASGAMTYQDESWVGTRLTAARGALADLETLGVRLPEPRHPSTRT